MLRDRRSLAIMFGIPLVLYPLLTVIIGTVGFSKKEQLTKREAKIAVVNVDGAPQLVTMLREKESGVTVVTSEDPKHELAKGTLDAIVVIPDNAERDALAAGDVDIVTQLDRSRTSTLFVESRLTRILSAYERWIIEQRLRNKGESTELLKPLKKTTLDIATAYQRFGKLMGMSLPVLLLMTGMLGALFPALNATTTERELGTLETLLVTPAGRMELLVAKGALVLLSALLTAGLNMLSMALVIWRSLSLMESQMGQVQIDLPALALTYLAAVPTLITFATLVLIVGLVARNFREANSLATPVMMIPLASMLVAIAEPEMTPGLLVTPVANTTLIIREVLTGRITAGPFVLAFISSTVYAGLLLSLAARVFTNEQLVNPSWEPVSMRGLRRAGQRTRGGPRRRLPAVDAALALFSLTLLLYFYIAPSLEPRVGLIPALILQQVCLLAGPALLLAWFAHYDWIETFSLRKPAMAAIAAGLLLGIGLAPWMQLAAMLQQKIWPRGMESQLELLKKILPILEQHPILLPALIGVLAGVCEELLFRGPIQKGLMRRMGMWPAIVIAAVLFAAAHLDLPGMPIRTFLGVVLGWIVVRTGSIFPAMLMHAAYDITQLGYISYEVQKQGAQKLLAEATTQAAEPINVWVLIGGAALIVIAMMLLRRTHRAQSLENPPAQPALS
ncbi:MAG: sodium transport system permease protein [Phycisphaerales bacterium]|nr:sodium transport system permease protein [Phycisphaerales bacterium]